jgi:phosphohistidine phosphatase
MSTLFKIEEEKELYHASKEEILSRIQEVPEKIQTLLIVGHNPGLEEFISWILAGSIVSIPLQLTTGSFVQMNLNISLWSEIAPDTATLQLMIPGRFSSKLSK